MEGTKEYRRGWLSGAMANTVAIRVPGGAVVRTGMTSTGKVGHFGGNAGRTGWADLGDSGQTTFTVIVVSAVAGPDDAIATRW